MKKVIIAMLIACMGASGVRAEVVSNPPKVSAQAIADLNQPLPKQEKITTGTWIWVAVLVIVGSVFGGMAYNTKKPI